MVSIDLIQFLKSSPYIYTEWYSERAENGLTYMLNGIQKSPTSQTRPATECLRDRNRQQSAQNTGSKGRQGEPLSSVLLWPRFSMDIIHHPIYESWDEQHTLWRALFRLWSAQNRRTDLSDRRFWADSDRRFPRCIMPPPNRRSPAVM